MLKQIPDNLMIGYNALNLTHDILVAESRDKDHYDATTTCLEHMITPFFAILQDLEDWMQDFSDELEAFEK